jgi:hypothetical protein
MTFLPPTGLPPEGVRELERACITAGPDHMPQPTRARLEAGQLLLTRDTDESGHLTTPWYVPGAGLLMTASATLMERPAPYPLALELARGKVNQVRSQAADWQLGGLHVPPGLAQEIRDATFAFGRAVTRYPAPAAEQEAHSALGLGYHAAERLVQAYVGQVFQIRHQRQPQLETGLGCRVADQPTAAEASALAEACNTAVIPFCWHDVERGEGDYHWQASEAALAWAESAGLHVAGGPLVDFSQGRMPEWAWLYERDRSTLAQLICDYVEVVVKRYQDRVRAWHLSAAANLATVFALGEEEMLWLTLHMVEAVRRIDPSLEVTVGLAQPWGDYLVGRRRVHSPFVFADTLLRNGVQLASLDVEVFMGVGPRGSYCRDLLELSRVLDLYALLGVPLQVSLAYPAWTGPDPQADPSLAVDAGFWHAGISPDGQADWAENVVALCLAKPYTRAVHWAQLSDAVPHQLPHCGLVDGDGQVRPALQRLRQLRKQHLR